MYWERERAYIYEEQGRAKSEGKGPGGELRVLNIVTQFKKYY